MAITDVALVTSLCGPSLEATSQISRPPLPRLLETFSVARPLRLRGRLLLSILARIVVSFGFGYRPPIEWWALQGLNLRPLPCRGSALPLS